MVAITNFPVCEGAARVGVYFPLYARFSDTDSKISILAPYLYGRKMVYAARISVLCVDVF